jgi:hypothetical protein
LRGVRIVLSTKRMRHTDDAPLAIWWAGDESILELDSTRRPLVDALVGDASRAPIWLTMFELTVDEAAAPRDPRFTDVELPPVRVPDDLQDIVTSYSE